MRAVFKHLPAELTLFLLALITSIVVANFIQRPVPVTHDEYAYLLAADTYSRGLLTNPSPFSPEHFETAHILLEPSYIAKYPAGQGLLLAFGLLFFGAPIVAVWISFAALIAVIYWTAKAYCSRQVALFAALFGCFQLSFNHYYVLGYWAQSYLGGTIAAISGALFWGSVVRMEKDSHAYSGLVIVLAIASVGLLLSRPFEGLLFIFLVCIIFARRLRYIICGLRRSHLIVAFSIGVAFLGFTAVNNRVVTGSAFVLPYVSYQRNYGCGTHFTWEKLPSPLTVKSPIHDIFCKADRFQSIHRYNLGTVGRVKLMVKEYFEFFLGAVWVGFLFIAAVVRDCRLARTSFFLLAVYFSFLSVSIWRSPSYVAPSAVIYFILVAQSLRVLIGLKIRHLAIGRLFAVALLSYLILKNMLVTFNLPMFNSPSILPERDKLALSISDPSSARDLVFVHYPKNSSAFYDWVKNEAQIEASGIIWAHSLDATKDQVLIDHHRDREVWHVIIGDDRPSIMSHQEFLESVKNTLSG